MSFEQKTDDARYRCWKQQEIVFLKKNLWIFAGSHVADRPLSIIPQEYFSKMASGGMSP